MAAIKSVSKLEDKVSSELWKRGLRFRRNKKSLFGRPDISIEKYKIVIFIDSCFWHQCPIHGNMPKTNIDYWQKKLNRNVERDRKVTEYYLEGNWNILRVWEHSFRENFPGAIDEITTFIIKTKSKYAEDFFK
ncbi:very short patch repair endonuclease [Oceanobacillus alkalisoli]|uniref:very short patch repair endonuclease n=1 Tax=Oceanobacillus alkalisoli TaxID=2925113 RepID=UPI001EF0177C|nr:very short patch repair endonuclease [Oceanobacillus alkalisoli]MCF3944901.1 very short patch repair endonuclease [Oceanobacillus alkalisoli]MCG5105184.1 very short patch repair endonuclease [Oceanobacillus alkalisoli]